MASVEDITDEEALWWLNHRCLSFRVGNIQRQFVGSFNVEEDGLIETTKCAMVRMNKADEEQQKDS